ncbi:pyridoxamine 5'-phosphate oxidase family protein [Aliikangiella marina]|uniref:Pyridoxamine 5'-phosphate oxidase family protein n=1 Tax=Aliikangiella marina TaxID=1712262 RepID=A0A545TD99_9GAMM|nr:pyridoxamine 5'-phosphate oxidase family protein [Aliikangiella marina]TQV75189.1 pyridoxamine 5'-phosphate oxidase family protein [Aliikangiella marina]
MGQQFSELSDKHIEFIEKQKVFFVGTATNDSRVNISPKGMDSFRVINSNKILWLNVTGSGNETAAHVQSNPRMTIMFMALEGNPLILRLYGQAKVIHQSDELWNEYFPLFNPLPGARQIFELDVDLVQNSCGMAVPFFDYAGDRQQLKDWAVKKGESGLKDYWQQKNTQSIDGLDTNIVEKNIK